MVVSIFKSISKKIMMRLDYNRRLNHISNIISLTLLVIVLVLWINPVIQYSQAGYFCPEVTNCGKFDSTRFTEVSKNGHQSVSKLTTASLITWSMHHVQKIPQSNSIADDHSQKEIVLG